MPSSRSVKLDLRSSGSSKYDKPFGIPVDIGMPNSCGVAPMIKKTAFASYGAVIGCLMASRADAQSTFQPNWASFGSANLGMNTLAHQQDTLHGRTVEARRAGALRRATTPTTYVSDPAVTRRVAEAFADHVGRIAGPEKGRVVREELSRRDFVAAWRTMTAADGYRSGDVADAFAAYWALNWAMANGADPSPGQSAGARRQVHVTMSSNPAFIRLSPAQRQEMSEAYMVNFIYQQGEYVDAMKRGDRDRLHRLSDAAVSRFENEMHVDLRRLALTDSGFVKRG